MFDIHPFTIEERDLIIDAFRTGKFERYKGSHIHYADYKVISELTRLALARQNATIVRNDIPLFPIQPGAGVVTPELVNQLRDEI